MSFFVAHHVHPPESCPVACDRGTALLAHISAASAARCGIVIQAEAVIDHEHRLLFVLEAANRESVECFLDFLLQFGDLQVLPASSAEQAAGRGGCGMSKDAVQERGGIEFKRSTQVMSSHVEERSK